MINRTTSTGRINCPEPINIIVTVDSDTSTHPADSLSDETILSLLEEYKALPTSTVAAEVEVGTETIRNRLEMMATVGLIEHRETTNGDVWLSW